MEGEAEAGVAAQVEVAAEAVANHQGKCGLFEALTGSVVCVCVLCLSDCWSGCLSVFEFVSVCSV